MPPPPQYGRRVIMHGMSGGVGSERGRGQVRNEPCSEPEVGSHTHSETAEFRLLEAMGVGSRPIHCCRRYALPKLVELHAPSQQHSLAPVAGMYAETQFREAMRRHGLAGYFRRWDPAHVGALP